MKQKQLRKKSLPNAISCIDTTECLKKCLQCKLTWLIIIYLARLTKAAGYGKNEYHQYGGAHDCSKDVWM